ncbi:MAG TPA: ABC transporter substrate-binding protein [Phycisphaerales bacterium]|nr:ABC transporter substrate-binding protein [Phycisphaerales bacterium]
MQNRFGLKDFVVILGLLAVIASVWLTMKQDDHRFKQNLELLSRISSLEQQVAQVHETLRSGLAVARPSERPATVAGEASGSAPERSTAWARPEVKISWQAPWDFARDPRAEPDYRAGGEFTEAFEAQPSKLTPVLGEDTYSRRIQDQVCDRLAEYDPESLELRGTLAEAWQYDPAGMWLRVKLRDEARFSDGRPVTAEDVRWTFHDYVNNPELETESLRSLLTQINRVEVVDERVAEYHFNEPNAYNLSAALQIYVLPSHFYKQFTPTQINQSTSLVMGSGPFKMKVLDPDSQWSPGQDIVLVRNELYWGPRPALAGLRFRTITNEQARLTAYRNGEVDMINPSSPQFVEVAEEPGWAESTYSLKWVNMRSGYSFIGWQCGPRNGRLTPFHDKRVRLAMTHLLDRERMIRDIWSGIGEVAVGPNNPPSPAADPSITPYPFDIDRARALLGEAGWVDRDGDQVLENELGDEFAFEFTRSSGSQISERIAKFVADSCASVGIRCTDRPVDWAMYDQILKTRDFDALIMAWSASAPESDPSQIWHTDSIQNQGHNFIQWDAGQDEIIERIRTTLDDGERMEAFHEFHRLVHEEQPYTFVRVAPWLRFIDSAFANVHTYPKGLEQREYYIPAPVPAQ